MPFYINMNFRRIKLITFDATNTLLKFRIPPCWHYYAIAARDFGFKGTENEVKRKFIDSYKEMWEKYPNFGKTKIPWDMWWRKVVEKTFEGQLTTGQDIALAKILIEEYKTSKLWYVAEGGRQLLNILDQKGITAGIISNFDPRLHDILESLGIKDHFKFIITSYEVGCSKPDKQIFNHAMSKSGLRKASECLHIGDDVKKDYEGSRGAGWHALVVPAIDGPWPSEVEQLPREHVYPNLQALADAFQTY